ncbi:MAG: dihydropteroate synthase [Actinomycetota bacterium]|nr:dihydropteroate synthase [Actinomycetota bacterium]MDD5666320.1 dihydropteroate synthase [Actinomycetota bacterium]
MRFNPRFLDVDGLEEAYARLDELKPSEQGRAIMAPKMVFRVVRVDNLDTKAANILKQNMLSIGGEVSLPREVFDYGGVKVPAVISGNLKHYRQLISKLKRQPFGLKALALELEELLRSSLAEVGRTLRMGGREYDLGERTLVMGVVNVTPDSFSDGGLFADARAAVEHALRLEEEGADILDIGGESTRPGSDFIPLEEELHRVMPVIEGVMERASVPVSIDTTKAEVARRALAAGCAMVNEISAMRLDPEMLPLVAEEKVPVCLMHMQGMPKDMQVEPRYDDLMGEIASFLRERAEAAVEGGVAMAKIMVDPGIGFGKTIQHNLEIIHRLGELKSLGYILVLGTSRKRFIGRILDLPEGERVEGTAASVALGIAGGADIVRVHDVKEMVRVARVADAIVGKG